MHSKLTVCAVYGHNDGSSAIPAILRSMHGLSGAKGLLLSPIKPKNLAPNITWNEILPMNYKQYNLFVLFCLRNFIKTEFVLIVQDDGYVLNGNNWNPEFYKYDYIGAPCHAAIKKDQMLTGFSWINEPNVTIIQNGGFSLRSMRLLEAMSKYGVMFQFSDHDLLQHEDIQISGIYRGILENHQIKFAPVELAMKFSIEYLGPKLHDNLDFSKLLGMHGKIRKLVSLQTIKYQCSHNQVKNIFRENEIVKHLIDLGFNIEYTDTEQFTL